MRVAITTDRFPAAARPFAQAGLEPVALPCIEVVPGPPEVLDRAREAAQRADLVLVSSARVVELLWPDAMPAIAVAAVGAVTARAVRTRGGLVAIESTGGLGDLVDRLPVAASIVYPHAAGSHARAQLTAALSALMAIEVYRTVPIPPAADRVRAAAFASPSAVAGWLLARDFEGIVLGAIGATTAAALAELRPPEVLAPRPSFASLAQALAQYLEVAA